MLVNVDAAAQRERIEELLPLMAQGDVRRGHAVFHSSKAACSACHRLGYAGGTVGPELTRIGETRTERDLLESILYPSLSFVRSYEPVLIITVEGRTISGTIRDETPQEYVLATGPDQEMRVPREEVEQIQPSTVSDHAGRPRQATHDTGIGRFGGVFEERDGEIIGCGCSRTHTQRLIKLPNFWYVVDTVTSMALYSWGRASYWMIGAATARQLTNGFGRALRYWRKRKI